jgi:hypothetical protein
VEYLIDAFAHVRYFDWDAVVQQNPAVFVIAGLLAICGVALLVEGVVFGSIGQRRVGLILIEAGLATLAISAYLFFVYLDMWAPFKERTARLARILWRNRRIHRNLGRALLVVLTIAAVCASAALFIVWLNLPHLRTDRAFVGCSVAVWLAAALLFLRLRRTRRDDAAQRLAEAMLVQPHYQI